MGRRVHADAALSVIWEPRSGPQTALLAEAGFLWIIGAVAFGAASEFLVTEKFKSKVRDKFMGLSRVSNNWSTFFFEMFDGFLRPAGKR